MNDPRPASALEKLRALEAGGRRSGPAPRTPGTARRKGIGGAIAVAIFMAWKFKAVLFLVLGKFKFLLVGLKLLKFGKLFSTGWTMILSMWLYSLYFGAPFAIGFVLLILIHELGHGLAARLIGLPVSAPIFIPFFGAVIALKRMPRTTFQDFIIGVGGPLAGTLGGLLCLWMSGVAGGHWGQLLYVLAYFTLVINMFNLMPIWQLDGARIAAPFRVSMWALSLAILAPVTFWVAGAVEHLNPMALFIVLAGAYRLVKAWWAQRSDRRRENLSALEQLAAAGRRRAETRDEEVTDRQRWISWGSYVGLTSLLIILVHQLHGSLPNVG